MTRWIMLVVTILGLVLSFGAKTPGLLGIGLLLVLIGVVGFVFAMAADRIAANARPEASMAAVEDLAALRRKRAAAPAPPRPATPAAPTTIRTEEGDRPG
jgi:disulfide bond formation protein DsbB